MAKAHYDKLLDKATSPRLLEADLESNLQICDLIRGGDVPVKYAVKGIWKKLRTDNPHVAMFALQLLEICAKNCGGPFHDEISTKDFMDFYKDIVKTRQDPVKAKLLELIQIWAHAFQNEPKFRLFKETFESLKDDGYDFPALQESEASAMFTSETAPQWKEGKRCNVCRSEFGTLTTRQHHCRSCGEPVCDKCSSHRIPLPKFGIEREVRVCDNCFKDIAKGGTQEGEPVENDENGLPAEYLKSALAHESQVPPSKSDVQEEEELQLALAISASENEAKAKRNLVSGMDSRPAQQQSPVHKISTDPSALAPADDGPQVDPELAKYLNRNYWQQRAVQQQNEPSAPVSTEAEATSNEYATLNSKPADKPPETDDEKAEFLRAMRRSIDIFMNRMRSNSARGRSLQNDSTVQSLFGTLNAMHPKLMEYLRVIEEKRAYYESIQEKLQQVREAREALDVLRAENAETKRRQKEELERQRQMQMMQKLDALRQQKRVYLEQQRQQALVRMQEEERMMQVRLQQQKQAQINRQYQQQYPAYATGYMPQSVVGYPQQPQQQVPAAAYMDPTQQPYYPQGYAPAAMPGQVPVVGQSPYATVALDQQQMNIGAGQPQMTVAGPTSMVQPPSMVAAGQPPAGVAPVTNAYNQIPGMQMNAQGQYGSQPQQPGVGSSPMVTTGIAAQQVPTTAPPIAQAPYQMPNAAMGMQYYPQQPIAQQAPGSFSMQGMHNTLPTQGPTDQQQYLPPAQQMIGQPQQQTWGQQQVPVQAGSIPVQTGSFPPTSVPGAPQQGTQQQPVENSQQLISFD